MFQINSPVFKCHQVSGSPNRDRMVKIVIRTSNAARTTGNEKIARAKVVAGALSFWRTGFLTASQWVRTGLRECTSTPWRIAQEINNIYRRVLRAL